MRNPLGLMAGLLLLSGPAVAESTCPPLKMIASVDLIPSANQRHHYVEVQIAGQKKLMVLDLGAEVSMLSQKAADDLDLKTHEANIQVYTVTGAATNRYTSADVQLGRLHGDIKMMVAPVLDDLSDDPRIVGLLGADVLSNFDLSIDYGTRKLDLLDRNHCEGNILYWPAQAVATVPFKIWHNTQIVFDVILDGKPVKAILDTGASNSTLKLDYAVRTFDIHPGDADTPVSGHLNERVDLITYGHTFKTLDFNGIAVSNPKLELIPEKLSSKVGGPELGSHIRARDDAVDAPILLGMNVLKHLHIYIAYKEKKIYITPAGTPSASQ
jgi:predicted aspartyl protease